MSADSSQFDPYRTPALPDVPYAAGGSRRPGWLTALCVICIVLGALGIGSGLISLGGTVFGRSLQTVMSPRSAAGATDEMEQVRHKFEDEMNRVQDQFFTGIIVAGLAKVGVALLLLLGGIQCLGLKEFGRKLLIAACLAAVVFELAHMILQTLVNMEMVTIFNSFFEGMMQTLPRRAESQAAEGMLGFMRGAMIFSMIIPYLLVLGKIVLYVWGALPAAAGRAGRVRRLTLLANGL